MTLYFKAQLEVAFLKKLPSYVGCVSVKLAIILDGIRIQKFK